MPVKVVARGTGLKAGIVGRRAKFNILTDSAPFLDLHIEIQGSTHAYTRTHRHTQTHIDTHAHTDTQTHAHTQTHRHAHLHRHTQTQADKHTQSHLHTLLLLPAGVRTLHHKTNCTLALSGASKQLSESAFILVSHTLR